MKSAKTKAISKMIFVIAIMLTSALVIETAIAQPADSPWPMSRFDAQGTAKSPYTGPDEPAIKWKFGTGYFVNSAPAIAEDGTIYVASRDDHLYAINPDGSEKWAVEMGFASPNPYLAPAIGEDGTIYITTYGDGILHALHPADGHEIWNVTIGCHICNPVIGDDGTIYLVRIRKGLYAINPDGSIKWQISAYLNMNIALSPDSGTVYLRTGSRKFAAVNAADGSIVWEIEVPLGYEYLAVGPDGTIYAAASRDHLVALEPISGTQKWDVDIESTLGPPAIDAGRSTVYVFTGNDFLSAITFSGTLKWKLAIGDAWHLDSAPIIGADGTVYVSTDGVGVLYAVDPDTGELKWSISGGNYAPAMGADGTIYLGYSHALNAIGEAEPTIFRNNSYLYVHKSMSWHDAKTYAKSLGGHLVTINDSEEHQFVYRLAGESGKVGKFWIGLTDEVEEGTFTWVTGEPLDFTLWYHTGEPTDEDYGVYSGSRWGTVNESVLRQFMVEFEGLTPPPLKTVSLAEAVDNTGLTWITGGDADWFGQTSTYYHDSDAAQSGAVSHNQYSWIQTVVSGPGTLGFYWKVSSEANTDSLEFYIDCIKQDSISGDIDWQQKSYEISPGTHTLMWKYAKNGDTDSGSDCGWLDKVEFSGGPGPTSSPAPAKKPDLTPYELTWKPTDPTTSDNITITWRVKNQGDADAVGNFYTELYVDGDKKDTQPTDGLAAGESTSGSKDIGTLSAGDHPVKIVTDTTGIVDESDESNNEYTKTLTVTEDTGYLWLSDFTNDKIYKVDPSGTVLASFDSPGSVPSDLAWDGTYLWNLDKAAGKIYKLDTAGTVIDSINAPGYINPTYAGGGLAWDGTYLWCTDDGWGKGYTNKIFKLDTSGNLITSFDAPQDNSYSAGLAWDGTHLWYERDYTNAELNNEIYKLDTTGYVSDHFTAPGPGSNGLAWDGSYFWVADARDDKIYQLDTTGKVLKSFSSPGSSPVGLAWA